MNWGTITEPYPITDVTRFDGTLPGPTQTSSFPLPAKYLLWRHHIGPPTSRPTHCCIYMQKNCESRPSTCLKILYIHMKSLPRWYQSERASSFRNWTQFYLIEIVVYLCKNTGPICKGKALLSVVIFDLCLRESAGFKGTVFWELGYFEFTSCLFK